MFTTSIQILGGTDIADACKEACAQAKLDGCNVEFQFNGQLVHATPDSEPGQLEQEYRANRETRLAAYFASPEYKALQAEQERREDERQAKLDAYLADGPESMSLRDADAWQALVAKNSDPYGSGIASYAERWARLMEARMSKGEQLEAIADECSRLADSEGITGFMYGCAVGALARVWTHGEQLRRWHNLKTQLRNEGEEANESGGVLNPACLTINP